MTKEKDDFIFPTWYKAKGATIVCRGLKNQDVTENISLIPLKLNLTPHIHLKKTVK